MKNLNFNLLIFGIALASVLCFLRFLLFNVNAGPENPPNIALVFISLLLCFFLPPFIVAFKSNKLGAVYGLFIGTIPALMVLVLGGVSPIFILFMVYMLAPLGGYFGELTSKLVFKP